MNPYLTNVWRGRNAIAWLLWPLAKIHGLLVSVRRVLYLRGMLPAMRFDVPVIVVGNVVVGGAGKTPLVMALVRHLQAQDLQVGVVSRGYGRAGLDPLEVGPHTPVGDSGDEPALIQRTTGAPVFVAKRRIDALRNLMKSYPGTSAVVCDDGLQHYALERDIEIAVFDDRGTGNGWLLPAGPLREPWPARRSQGIDLVLHTGQKPAFEGYVSHRQLADHGVAADGSKAPLTSLAGSAVTALAGIANPEAFFSMLRARGLTLKNSLAYPDHHDFKIGDLVDLVGQTVVCTEKDAVKLFALPTPPGCRLLAIPLEFLPEPAFFQALDALMAPLLSHLPSRHGHQTH
jgi:tetraacyldisaccharide 4'-kinase